MRPSPKYYRSNQCPKHPHHFSGLYLTYVNEYTLSFYILTVYVFLRMIIMGLRRVLLNALRSISRRHHGEGSRTQILHLYFTSTVSLFSTCSSCSCGLYFASPSCVYSDPCSTTNTTCALCTIFDSTCFYTDYTMFSSPYVYLPYQDVVFVVCFLLLAVPNSPLK